MMLEERLSELKVEQQHYSILIYQTINKIDTLLDAFNAQKVIERNVLTEQDSIMNQVTSLKQSITDYNYQLQQVNTKIQGLIGGMTNGV